MFLFARYLLSMFSVLFVSLKALGLPCLAVSGYTIPFVRSMFRSFRLHSSMGLSPVSFDIAMAVASFLDALAIMQSILASCGILGSFVFWVYLGLFHVKPCIFT